MRGGRGAYLASLGFDLRDLECTLFLFDLVRVLAIDVGCFDLGLQGTGGKLVHGGCDVALELAIDHGWKDISNRTTG